MTGVLVFVEQHDPVPVPRSAVPIRGWPRTSVAAICI